MIKREQADFFRTKTQQPEEGEVIVQMDFSENYETKEQITIFTAVAWFRSNQEVTTKSYVFVSDYLSHDKYAVDVFTKKIIQDLHISGPHIMHTLHIFSDGAASQFKQKYNLCNITFIPDVKVHWHFFATSHGKGSVDGIGGQVKRDAWLAALSGAKIQNAHDFVLAVSKKRERKTNVVEVNERD